MSTVLSFVPALVSGYIDARIARRIMANGGPVLYVLEDLDQIDCELRRRHPQLGWSSNNRKGRQSLHRLDIKLGLNATDCEPTV